MDKIKEDFTKKYSLDPPGKVLEYSFLKGILVENSYGGATGESNYLFKTGHETISVLAQTKEESVLILKTDPIKKAQPSYRSAADLIYLSLQYAEEFERSGENDRIENVYISSFGHTKAKIDKYFSRVGRVISATDIANSASIIELLLRDDRAYTALSALDSSIKTHYCCLMCELSNIPVHDHTADTLTDDIGKIDLSIKKAYKAVENIIGDPLEFKKWTEVDISPLETFKKADKTYLDFYKELFFYAKSDCPKAGGNIDYSLLQRLATQSQCFAALVLNSYIENNILEIKEAINKLSFNKEFLSRIPEETLYKEN